MLILSLLQERLPSCGDFHLIRSGALVSDGGGDHKGGLAAACAESINAIIFARMWPSVLKVSSACMQPMMFLASFSGLPRLARFKFAWCTAPQFGFIQFNSIVLIIVDYMMLVRNGTC
jgi:hypothetical protein